METTISEKIKMIDAYITKLDQVMEKNDNEQAQQLDSEIIAVYQEEIHGLTSELDRFSVRHAFSNTPINYVGDARLLKAKLNNYKVNLSSGLYGLMKENRGGITLNQTQNTEARVNVEIEISFEKAIENVNNLPDDVLEKEDKELLQGKLIGIELAKKNGESKTTIWEKIKPVLIFLADKGADAAIAAMPYIITLLQKLG